MYKLALALVAVGLTACAPTVPESGAPAGVGFENYSDYRTYRSDREEALAGQGAAPAPQPQTVLPPQTYSRAPVAEVASPTPVQTADAGSAPVVATENPGISDEQDFSAVSNRQSIQSDRERLAAQREAYQVIQPTALPTRDGSSGPNIVQYALSTTNRVGEQVHKRTTAFSAGKFERNCANYASSDLAQEAFLASGGPERDRNGLDPDGDGFACNWDPSPFRRVTVNR